MLKSNPLPEKNLMIEIGFNQEKLDEEGEYTYEAMCNATLKPYFKENFKVMYMTNGNLIIYDGTDDEDLGALMRITFKLYDAEWFKKYLSELKFYNAYEATADTPFPYEDMLVEIPIADRMYGIS